MKFISLLVLLSSFFSYSQISIDFDSDVNWIIPGSGYRGDIIFSSGNFVATSNQSQRADLAVVDGQPSANGTYAWDIDSRTTANANWVCGISNGGVNEFTIGVRRYTSAPELDALIEYTIDNGATWVFISTIDNTTLNNSSAYQTFGATINSPNSDIAIRIRCNSATERFFIDDFVYTEFIPCANSSSITEVACNSFTVPSGDETYTFSGTYTDTIPNAANCDSVITIDLTINNDSDSTITIEACENYTVPSGDETYTLSGTYNDTIATTSGCDSVLTINLTIKQNSNSNIIETACDSYTVPSGDETHTVSGIYMDTIPNGNGCDSVISIDLTIINSSTGNLTINTCNSYTVPSGDDTYTLSGIYSDTLTNNAGCDSVITIDLTIVYDQASTISVTACESYTVPSGDETYTLTGVYEDTLQSTNGCDSVITIDLTVNYKQSSNYSITSCYSYSVPSGDETYTVSGTYNDTILTVKGCDSLMTINVTIKGTVFGSETIAACDSFQVPSADETYYTSGTYNDTIPSSDGCDSVITYTVVVNYSSGSSVSLAGCESVTYNGQTYTESGTYEQFYTNAVGCDSVVTITAFINFTPPTPIASNDTSICFGSDLPLLVALDDTAANLIITGVFDGPLDFGQPKVIELFAFETITDLSLYGIGSSENGTGFAGEEFTFPVISVQKGTFVRLTSSGYYFNKYFGTSAHVLDSTSSGYAALDFDGNDAIELYHQGELIDLFGNPNVNGTGEAWDYQKGWAYRKNHLLPNAGDFDDNKWNFSGANGVLGETSNNSAVNRFNLDGFYFLVADQWTWYTNSTLSNIVGNQSTYQVFNSNVGSHTYYVTNKSGNCISGADSVVVTVLDAPVIGDITVIDADQNPGNGSINITVTGGLNPYSFSWSNGAITEDISDLNAGVYTVVVTDDLGCFATDSAEITNYATVDEFTLTDFGVYPNPSSSGLFTLELTGSESTRIFVQDMSGRVILEEEVLNPKHQINLSDVASGMYQLVVVHGNMKGTRLLVKR
jgi:hypothetical protein